MKEKFDVTGMTCSACSSRVEKCVSKLEGVEEVTVNLLTNSMQVKYDENVLEEQGIIDAVVHAAMEQVLPGRAVDLPEVRKERLLDRHRDNRERTEKSGAGASGIHEEADFLVFCVSDSPDVCVHGTYDRRATSRIFAWNGKCSGFCYDSVFAVSSSVVY